MYELKLELSAVTDFPGLPSTFEWPIPLQQVPDWEAELAIALAGAPDIEEDVIGTVTAAGNELMIEIVAKENSTELPAEWSKTFTIQTTGLFEFGADELIGSKGRTFSATFKQSLVSVDPPVAPPVAAPAPAETQSGA